MTITIGPYRLEVKTFFRPLFACIRHIREHRHWITTNAETKEVICSLCNEFIRADTPGLIQIAFYKRQTLKETTNEQHHRDQND